MTDIRIGIRTTKDRFIHYAKSYTITNGLLYLYADHDQCGGVVMVYNFAHVISIEVF